MTCDEIRRLLVEDAPPMETIREHARGCEACAALLARDRQLDAAVARWREATSKAPARLRGKVLDAIAAEAPPAQASRAPVHGLPFLGRSPRYGSWFAAAAILVVAILAAVTLLPGNEPDVVSVAGGLMVADALEKARQAERNHAEAIAALAAAAGPILAQGEDPSTPPAQASRLRAYQDRLASLDDAIAQVHRFLETNPGHAASRTMLLAAYIDKTELLREILERAAEERESA